MKVIQVKCPSCNQAIYSKVKDQLFFCENCKTLHFRNGGVEKLDFEIADFNQNIQGEKIYVPFWRLYCSFIVRSKQVEGGQVFKLFSWLTGTGDSGNLFIYVPANDVDPGTFKRLSSQFTSGQPRYKTRLDFGGVKRAPAAVSKTEAGELADFVVVTMEAEQPGTLQYLDYSLTVNDSKIVYLPFVIGPSGMTSAL